MFKRGDIVVTIASGDYGKPRPSLIVQADDYGGLPSVTVCLFSSDLQPAKPDLRITIEPTATNGLRAMSQVAIDKIITVPRSRIGQRIGRLSDAEMAQVTALLAAFLGMG